MIDKIKKHPYIFYTVLFCVLAVGVFIWFPLTRHNFIWKTDGLPQHYNALMYYGNYLRHIITHFEIPMWEFAMGYGADIIATMHYYTVGDPLNLLSVFVQPEYTEYLYIFLVLLRFYLSGIAFMKYTLYMGKGKTGSLIGAIVYVFCEYALFASVRHPYFANPMIYLPFILMGVEKIYRKESPKTFILFVFIATISNFYFLYMHVIFTVVYCIFRFFHYYHYDYIKNIIRQVIKFVCYSLVAILMAGFILIPALLLFFNTSRSQDAAFVPVLYNKLYYVKLLFAFNYVIGAGNFSYLGYAIITLITTTLLFIKKKTSRQLKIAFIFMTIGLYFPIVGSFMNGFAYVTNRWVFGYSLLVSYIVADVWNDLFYLSKRTMFILFGEFIVYVSSLICARHLSKYFTILSFFKKVSLKRSMLLCVFYLIILCALFTYTYIKQHRQVKRARDYVSAIILVCVSLNICLNANTKYINQKNVDEFIGLNKGYHMLMESTGHSLLKDIQNNEFYRVDTTYLPISNLNTSLQYNQSSLAFYYSLGSGYTTEYLTDMLISDTMSSKYQSVDTRPYLEALACSQYYLAEKTSKSIPYGFEKINVSNEKYQAYQNQKSLPLGYTYDSYLDMDTYKGLSAIQKQEALMQSVVLDDVENSSNKNLILHEDSVSFEEKKQKNIEYKDSHVKVLKKKGTYTIKVNSQYKGLLYLKVNNIYYNEESNYSTVYVTTEKYGQKSFKVATPYYVYYNGTHDFLVNLGYFENYNGTIEIQFEKKGDYTLDSIELYNQSIDNYDSYVNKLKENVLEDVEITTNQVNGNIELEKNKFLCLSIPYSTGWSAYVDGEKVEVQRANIMYMGIPLEKGNHHIQLKYRTPGLTVGIISTVVGFRLFTGVMYMYKKKEQENI